MQALVRVLAAAEELPDPPVRGGQRSPAQPDARGPHPSLLPDPCARRARDGAGRTGASSGAADYDHEGRRIHLLTTFAASTRARPGGRGHGAVRRRRSPRRGRGCRSLCLAARSPVRRRRHPRRGERGPGRVAFSRRLRRVVVAISGPGRGLGMAGTLHFTYRPVPDGGYREEELYRNLHPMMAKRLRLERLANFRLERLPSVEDVYLFHGTARGNPKDERLFARGRGARCHPGARRGRRDAVQLPNLERKLMQAVAGIRVFQAKRPPRGATAHEPGACSTCGRRSGSVTTSCTRSCGGWHPPPRASASTRSSLHASASWSPARPSATRRILRMSNPVGTGAVAELLPPSDDPVPPLTDYQQTGDQDAPAGARLSLRAGEDVDASR